MQVSSAILLKIEAGNRSGREFHLTHGEIFDALDKQAALSAELAVDRALGPAGHFDDLVNGYAVSRRGLRSPVCCDPLKLVVSYLSSRLRFSHWSSLKRAPEGQTADPGSARIDLVRPHDVVIPVFILRSLWETALAIAAPFSSMLYCAVHVDAEILAGVTQAVATSIARVFVKQ